MPRRPVGVADVTGQGLRLAVERSARSPKEGDPALLSRAGGHCAKGLWKRALIGREGMAALDRGRKTVVQLALPAALSQLHIKDCPGQVRTRV
jgi:hypothetical protein